jgi:hypothetical protein
MDLKEDFTPEDGLAGRNMLILLTEDLLLSLKVILDDPGLISVSTKKACPDCIFLSKNPLYDADGEAVRELTKLPELDKSSKVTKAPVPMRGSHTIKRLIRFTLERELKSTGEA